MILENNRTIYSKFHEINNVYRRITYIDLSLKYVVLFRRIVEREKESLSLTETASAFFCEQNTISNRYSFVY